MATSFSWCATRPRVPSTRWPASCDSVSVAPCSGRWIVPEVQRRTGDRGHPEDSSSGFREVVRYERQGPVIAFGRSEDSPVAANGLGPEAASGESQAGQMHFVHVAMESRDGYPLRRGNASESGAARAGAATGFTGLAVAQATAVRADGIYRWIGGVLQRMDAQGPRTDDRVIRSNRAADPVSSIIDREGRRRSS